jgi:hypothetical protein
VKIEIILAPFATMSKLACQGEYSYSDLRQFAERAHVHWANIKKRSLGEQALAGRLVICPEYECSLEGSLVAHWANTARTAPVLLKIKFFK